MNTSLEAILNEALMDEYLARDTYRKIIEVLGPVRPFVNIVEAEQTHIDALLPLYDRHGISPPEEPDPSRITPPDSLLDACEAGVKAEIENVAMYDRLLAATDLADARQVMKRLQEASRDHHLPAFQRCVEHGGAAGGGRGRGGGHGYGFGMGRGHRGGFGRGRRGAR